MNSSIFNFDAARSLRPVSLREKSWPFVIAVTFGLILVVGCQVLNAFNHVQVAQKTFRTEAIRALSPQTRVVFSGSSHVFMGIDPSRYSVNAMNLSSEALDYSCQETLFKKHLSKVPNLKIAVIEWDEVPLLIRTLKFYNGDNHIMAEMGIKPWEMPISNPLSKAQMLVGSVLNPIFHRPRLTPELWRYYRILSPIKAQASVIQAGFVPQTSSDSPSTHTQQRLKQIEELTTHSPEVNLSALIRIIKQLQSRGVRVVLLRFPHHWSYRQGRSSRLKLAVAGQKSTLQTHFPNSLTFWDLDAAPGFKDSDFLDSDHLNQFGARRLATLLNPRLEKLLRPSPPPVLPFSLRPTKLANR